MIKCDLHDYIEIACLYRYPIKLITKQGEVITGTAFDTARNAQKQECIKIVSDNTEQLIALNSLVSLEACTDNPHFKTVTFT